ncbi:MAG TPA: TonB-dependent receptor [Caulobacteraceae bacterium]|jgi:outer membrane receptor protein involved in Fe transport|nr:TonB-dependent receptor [Caulobacteraceae bacterium]
MKSSYMASCAVAAVLSGWAGVAAAADPSGAPADAQPNAPAAIQSDAAAGGGQELIVTAQRRGESVEKVPMTVQAFSGQTLNKLNVTTLDELLKYTPNVTFGTNGPGQGDVFMRGLSAGFRGNQSSATVADFPNVAIYLDDQSMQFPGRNVDIYVADMQRVEVLEGPQGTLFGGGAEAGAIRYITNKPKLDSFGGYVQVMGGLTDDGGPNGSIQATINVPVVPDKLAVRAVIYDDYEGGYIDNVPSTFTRSNQDLGNFYFGIHPVGGLCPNHLPAGAAGFCAPPNQGQINNYAIAKKDQNPTTYTGGRVSALYEINNDWNVLITESLQSLDAEGLSADYPVGSDFQSLKPLQVTAFEPSYDKDRYENTAWTVNGKIGDLTAVYTGAYMIRNISQQIDYTNYSRSTNGMYYQCTGGTTPWGGQPFCYSPKAFWHDDVHATHLSNEVRLSSPDDWRLRFIVGGYEEQFRIYDVMNFEYKGIPACSPANLAAALLPGGAPCLADINPAPGATTNSPGIRSDITGFGEDTQRGYDQWAGFASFDYDLIPGVLTLTAGTRYYYYNEYEVGSQYATNPGCLDVPNGQCVGNDININDEHYRTTYSGFKSRVNLTWHVDADTLAYFTFSQGFRPGGFNRSDTKQVIKDANGIKQFEEPGSYAPDSLNNYEVGLKTQLFDRRLQINLSAYWMDWTNVQFFLFDPPYSITTTFGINGPSYNVKGVEAQFVGRVTDGLTVQGSVSYNDDTETAAPCLKGNIPGTTFFNQCITMAKPSGGAYGPFANPFGVAGAVPAFSPTWQANVRARYEWRIDSYDAFVMAGANYVGDMFNQPASYESGAGVLIPATTYLRYLQPAYTTIDASAGISKDNWSAELFGTNLTNSHASTFTSSAQFIKSEVPLRPLVVGLKLGYKF